MLRQVFGHACSSKSRALGPPSGAGPERTADYDIVGMSSRFTKVSFTWNQEPRKVSRSYFMRPTSR